MGMGASTLTLSSFQCSCKFENIFCLETNNAMKRKTVVDAEIDVFEDFEKNGKKCGKNVTNFSCELCCFRKSSFLRLK